MVGDAAQRVGEAVVGDVHHGENVRTPHGFIDHRLRLAGAEAGALAVQEIGLNVVAAVAQIRLAVHQLLRIVFAELYNVVVDLLRQGAAVIQGGDL